jgi:hypothetical protein
MLSSFGPGNRTDRSASDDCNAGVATPLHDPEAEIETAMDEALRPSSLIAHNARFDLVHELRGSSAWRRAALRRSPNPESSREPRRKRQLVETVDERPQEALTSQASRRHDAPAPISRLSGVIHGQLEGTELGKLVAIDPVAHDPLQLLELGPVDGLTAAVGVPRVEVRADQNAVVLAVQKREDTAVENWVQTGADEVRALRSP